MKKLGKILRFSASGKALLHPTEIISKGKNVKNSSGKPAGRVVDIIGPVKNPYLLVKTSESIETELFY